MPSRLARLLHSPLLPTAGILIALGLLLLVAIHPYTFGTLPDTHDGLLHLYRLVALDYSIQHGDLWPRYSPGLIYGYGSPIFNYYAPLSLYLFEILHLLGFPFVDSFLIGLAIYALIGLVGAYQLGRVWLAGSSPWQSQVAGLMTAAAYTYAPYTLYNAPRRAAVAEVLALAVLPWLLWVFWRLAQWGRRRDFALAALLLAVFIPVHNITTLHVAVLLPVYSLYLWWISPDPRRALIRLLLAGLVALGLTTFFWLPALVEAGYVQLARATGPSSADFHNNFQTLAATFSPPLTADLGQMHPPVPRAIGWPQLILAFAGPGLAGWEALSGDWSERHWRGWLALCALGSLILIFLTTRASTWLWEHLPLIAFTQLPWRLLGLASLLLAVLAGAGALLVARRIPWLAGRFAWIGLCLVVMVLYAMPWLYVQYLPRPRARAIADVQHFERQTGWVATSSLAEYLPAWTNELPDPDRLIGLYARSDVIPRLQPNADVALGDAAWDIDGAALELTATTDTTLVFDWLFFPGWWATLDGERVRVYPILSPGFVAVDVPAGDHALDIGMGPTRLRLIAMIVSGVFLIPLVGLPFVHRLWPMAPAPDRAYHDSDWTDTQDYQIFDPWDEAGFVDYGEAAPLYGTEGVAPGRHAAYTVGLCAALGLALFALKALAIDNLETPIKRGRFAHGVEAGLGTAVMAGFGDQITLLGYDLPRPEVPSGGSARLNLYWQLADETIEQDYSSVVYLRDAAGTVIAVGGSQHPGDYPTSRWLPGFYAQERLSIALPPATPPGTYTLDVALYSHALQRNLDTFDSGGHPLGVTVEIGPLTITRPARRARLNDLDIEQRMDERLGNGLALIGAGPLLESAEVGQPFPLTLFWQAYADPGADYGMQVVWLADDRIAARSPVLAPTVGYPTGAWRRRDVWKGLHLLVVPGRLSAGEYGVGIRLLDPAGEPLGDPVVIGQMEISTPARTFDLPDADVEADTVWENGITLVGYDLSSASLARGQALDLTFYWQAAADLHTGLTFFVHLVDGQGQIAVQQDRIPQSGARPTTGWAPGEIVADGYVLFVGNEIPPGEYRLRIGWYDARTGLRIRLPGGIDFWLLPQVVRVR